MNMNNEVTSAVQTTHSEKRETIKISCKRTSNYLISHFDNLHSLNRTNAKSILKKLDQQLDYQDNMVLDFQGIHSIDGQGLTLLLQINNRLKKHGKKLLIINPAKMIQKIFDIMEIDKIIKVRKNSTAKILEHPRQAKVVMN